LGGRLEECGVEGIGGLREERRWELEGSGGRDRSQGVGGGKRADRWGGRRRLEECEGCER